MRKVLFAGLCCLVFQVVGCAAPMNIGTGLKYNGPTTNPEPDKYALVYIYRGDGWGYGKYGEKPLLVQLEQNGKIPMPVAIFSDQTYRPFLFEPQTSTLRGGSSTAIVVKAGETRCFEQGWRFRGLDVVILNEVSMEECYKALQNKELVHSLNEIRAANQAAPLAVSGFKEVIAPMPFKTQQAPESK